MEFKENVLDLHGDLCFCWNSMNKMFIVHLKIYNAIFYTHVLELYYL